MKYEYVQENGHEAFPYVSEYWHAINSRSAVSSWKRLDNFKTILPEKLLHYLNNTGMFAPPNQSKHEFSQEKLGTIKNIYELFK